MNGVPNVRTEIGGLKDEIARLRGVVSELAEDMRGSQGGPVARSSEPAPGVPDLADRGEEEGNAVLPEEFMQVSIEDS
jgi:hypothetical protein